MRELVHYAHLGLITLGSSLRAELVKRGQDVQILYFDGALFGSNEKIENFIKDSGQKISAIALSSHTHNYAACIDLARLAKEVNSETLTIIGNDHFSALASRIIARRNEFDVGFYGNDVVESFAKLTADHLGNVSRAKTAYPGMVYRDGDTVHTVPENPSEFHRLPLVNYNLVDSLFNHSDLYHKAQIGAYSFMSDLGLRAAPVDIARGCIKFGGPRSSGNVPLASCDFCGIVPGRKSIVAATTETAWARIKNAVDHGFNYLLLTADTLPSTFGPLLTSMAANKPSWYRAMGPERPKLMAYARAECFSEKDAERTNALIDDLGVDQFFIGLESFTEASLEALAKGSRNTGRQKMAQNFEACRRIADRGVRITAGVVVTHMGIRQELMEENFQAVKALLQQHTKTFVEVDFEQLMPIPGSLSFEYLQYPDRAEKRAKDLGVKINMDYIRSASGKYASSDVFSHDELVHDFILGCCPEVSPEIVDSFLERSRSLVGSLGIVGASGNYI